MTSGVGVCFFVKEHKHNSQRTNDKRHSRARQHIGQEVFAKVHSRKHNKPHIEGKRKHNHHAHTFFLILRKQECAQEYRYHCGTHNMTARHTKTCHCVANVRNRVGHIERSFAHNRTFHNRLHKVRKAVG